MPAMNEEQAEFTSREAASSFEQARDVAGFGGGDRVPAHSRHRPRGPTSDAATPARSSACRAARAPHLGVRDLRRFRRGPDVGVPRLADVVQGKRGPARTNTGPLEDPLVGRADVEFLEEAVRDLVLGIEVSQSEKVPGQM